MDAWWPIFLFKKISFKWIASTTANLRWVAKFLSNIYILLQLMKHWVGGELKTVSSTLIRTLSLFSNYRLGFTKNADDWVQLDPAAFIRRMRWDDPLCYHTEKNWRHLPLISAVSFNWASAMKPTVRVVYICTYRLHFFQFQFQNLLPLHHVGL